MKVMATATSDDFLSGQGVSVELHDVETELTRLWGPAAEQVGGPELQHPNVTRIVLSNLVVFSHCDDMARLQGVLDTVTAQHPSRTIVLRNGDEQERVVRAEISALCHLPAPGLPQVCSERIVLRAGPQALDLLPGAVRPLLEADLPFVLWWMCDPREDERIFRDLADECSLLILDLTDPGADPAALRLGLEPAICRFARDSAWFGLARWRELVAQFFDPPAHHETLARIDTLRIEATAPASDAPPRVAVWLAAWLAGQLEWVNLGTPTRSPGRLAARFLGPAHEVAVEIVTQAALSQPATMLNAVTLTTRAEGDAGRETFRLFRVPGQYPQVHVEIDSCAYCTLPRTVLCPALDPARRVSAALESSRNDPPFQKALPHLLWLLGL
jgi:glucose-6-phosphate dehydrogenase assembly protein OpcA